MYFSQLSEKDKQVVFQCLKAVSEGSFLEDEFHSRIGIEKDDLQKIIDSYPEIDHSDDDSNESLAVNNCLNEICHGLQFSETEWKRWFSVTREEIAETFKNWADLRGWNDTEIR
jgi:uncharacterized protein YccT (UPF0319 family)